jgi:hypothetical protein
MVSSFVFEMLRKSEETVLLGLTNPLAVSVDVYVVVQDVLLSYNSEGICRRLW